MKRKPPWYTRPNYMRGWLLLGLTAGGCFIAFCIWVAMMAGLPAKVEAGEMRLNKLEDILERMALIEELGQKQQQEFMNFYQQQQKQAPRNTYYAPPQQVTPNQPTRRNQPQYEDGYWDRNGNWYYYDEDHYEEEDYK